jgi:hypothetical protein
LHRHRLAPLIAFAILVALPAQMAAAQSPTGTAPQSCDPLIDGTYCATQGGSLRNTPVRSGGGMAPMQSLSGDLSLGQDSPATLGGISISGNTTCVGLLRRGACN